MPPQLEHGLRRILRVVAAAEQLHIAHALEHDSIRGGLRRAGASRNRDLEAEGRRINPGGVRARFLVLSRKSRSCHWRLSTRTLLQPRRSEGDLRRERNAALGLRGRCCSCRCRLVAQVNGLPLIRAAGACRRHRLGSQLRGELRELELQTRDRGGELSLFCFGFGLQSGVLCLQIAHAFEGGHFGKRAGSTGAAQTQVSELQRHTSQLTFLVLLQLPACCFLAGASLGLRRRFLSRRRRDWSGGCSCSCSDWSRSGACGCADMASRVDIPTVALAGAGARGLAHSVACKAATLGAVARRRAALAAAKHWRRSETQH